MKRGLTNKKGGGAKGATTRFEIPAKSSEKKEKKADCLEEKGCKTVGKAKEKRCKKRAPR